MSEKYRCNCCGETSDNCNVFYIQDNRWIMCKKCYTQYKTQLGLKGVKNETLGIKKLPKIEKNKIATTLGWQLIQNKEEFKTWINTDNLLKVNKNYDLQNSIGKMIGFRYQRKDGSIQEKWIELKSLSGNKMILANDFSFEVGHVKRYNVKKIFDDEVSNVHTEPLKYIKNEKDKNRYIKSNERIECICPYCGTIKWMLYGNLKRFGFSCNGCSDGFSFPEKFMTSVLNQLNVKFTTQLTKNTFNWCGDFRYDFYLLDHNIIIETHGEQHFNTKTTRHLWKDYEEEHENDLLKYDLAVLNGFEYNKNFFWIDCRKSTLNWMKENIIKELGNVFDLSNINWQQCLDYACSNLQHQVWEWWRIHANENNECVGIKDVKKVFPELSHDTIGDYLRNGNDCGKCVYDPIKANAMSRSLEYYVVDVIDKTEHYERNSILMAEYLNTSDGTIIDKCKHHKNNNDFNLLNSRYLCFYKETYTNLNDVLNRYNSLREQQEKELARKELINSLKKVLSVKQKEENEVIVINDQGIIENKFLILKDCAEYFKVSISKIYTLLNNDVSHYHNNKLIFYKNEWNNLSDFDKSKYVNEMSKYNIKVVKIDNDLNEELLLINYRDSGYLEIKRICDETFKEKHQYKTNVLDGYFYCYQDERNLITDERIQIEFNIIKKISNNDRDTSVIAIDLYMNQLKKYEGITDCARQINGNRSSIGKICNETNGAKNHRYMQGRYLIYFTTQWNQIPCHKQEEIIKLGKHIN